MIRKALIALALSGAFASAQAGVVLQEGFDDVSTLAGSGWVMTNASSAGGITGWFQGDQQVFGAQAGAADSYIAANYDNAPVGGTISNWLITPEFSTASATTVSLWLRGDDYPGYFDQVAFGFSSGGSAIADFAMGGVQTVPTGDWFQYTFQLGAQGAGSTGRFAIQYTGNADDSNYIGVDSLSVASQDTSLPEPGTMLIMAAGLAGLAAARRRRA